LSGEGKEEPKEPEAPRSHATNTSLQVYHDKMIGSGAEGAVFFGRLGERDVAVKRTRSGTTAHEAKMLRLCQSKFVVELLHEVPGALALELLHPARQESACGPL